MITPDQATTLAEQVLNNPTLLRQLSDRVYELWIEEVRNQRDRLGLGRRA